jgi:hypothetical protein
MRNQDELARFQEHEVTTRANNRVRPDPYKSVTQIVRKIRVTVETQRNQLDRLRVGGQCSAAQG